LTLAGAPRLELWGGLECTVVRIGNDFRNQIEETGHLRRAEDLDLIAGLGMRTLRYPVVWETVCPNQPDVAEWRWHDERLGRLRQLEITPIAGLVHHGSGPAYTNLVDPEFPELLASYAARVAERYPWITQFTPVNEPLTTARFSALYGHWYPHSRSNRAFLRALVNQCAGVREAMRAIRRITPGAMLVQTEDLGKSFSTPLLKYQADFENERRWLSFDLLCGRVGSSHPLYEHLLENGIFAHELEAFIGDPCVPDIVGINHYLTSERYLDERIDLYPECFHGGNATQRYADVEAVRMDLPEGWTGPEVRLREAWERYHLPLAVTEAHHGCSRDDQVRWLSDVWNAAAKLKVEGADIRAVTIWSLFGAQDWNTLLTRRNGFYEPGAFDVRAGRPRPTALARAASELTSNGAFDHPVLDTPGWWGRHERFYRPPARIGATLSRPPRRLVITGATGTLGQALAHLCRQRGLDHVLLSRRDMDIADAGQVEAMICRYRPWAVINAAGYVRVADAAREQDRCMRENALGPERLAQLSTKNGIRFVTFSSDLVFDGRLGRPYTEHDPACPTGHYGASKVQAEARVSACCPDALIVRTSAFFGPWDTYNFVHRTLSRLAVGERVTLSTAQMVSPTYVPDLAGAVLDLLVDSETGLWHLANAGATSWYELGRFVADRANIRGRGIVPEAGESRNTALTSVRGQLMPSLDDAVERFFRDCKLDWGQAALTSVLRVA
jgi:dTDP-4-dehydrorhamnose reductase